MATHRCGRATAQIRRAEAKGDPRRAVRAVCSCAYRGIFERAVRPVYAYADGGSFTAGGGYEPAQVKYQSLGSLLVGNQDGGGSQSSGRGGRAPFAVHVHISQGSPVDRRTVDQVGRAAFEGARRASIRNG